MMIMMTIEPKTTIFANLVMRIRISNGDNDDDDEEAGEDDDDEEGDEGDDYHCSFDMSITGIESPLGDISGSGTNWKIGRW